MKFNLLLLFTLLLLFSVPSVYLDPIAAQEKKGTPEEKSVKPGVNKDFLNPDLSIEEFLGKFEVESREVYTHREKLAELLELKPGMAIADIGSGTGAYLKTFSTRVGKEGRVYAVDISPKFVEYLRERSKKEGMDRVEVVLCNDHETRLSPGSIDAAYICDTYHHFEYPQSTLRSLHQALKPNGRLIVVDFDRVPGKSREWVLSHVRAGKQEFRTEIEQAGFHYVDEPKVDGITENFIMRFKK